MAKVVLLNSGGLDSAMVGKWLKNNGHQVHSFHIETDCINAAKQLTAAATTASNYCNTHRVFALKWGSIPNHWEVNTPRANMDSATAAFYPTDPPVRWYSEFTDPAAIYAQRPWNEFRGFPNQAMTFYSLGVTYAKVLGATAVYSGSRLIQNERYVNAYNEMADMLRLPVTRPQLKLPFKDSITYAQAAEILVGHPLTQANVTALRAEFAYTYSCRWPTPCGVCEKCTDRAAIGLV